MSAGVERATAGGRPSPAADPGCPALEVRGLTVAYETPTGPVTAVRDVSLTLARGETLGVVGESGCGKSSLAFAVMGYLGPSGRVSGDVRLAGASLLGRPDGELRAIRGARLAMVYQDPLSTLNPSLPVGEQIAEVYRAHRGASREVAWARAVETLDRVGIGDPGAVARRYPHQLSGGMQQRAVIAMALVCDPEVLILDEPTTGLDVTTEARVLDLVGELQRARGSAALYISHNLGVIARVCDRVAVMYAGEVVEESKVRALFRRPLHPYTAGLLGCVPRLSADRRSAPLAPIPGSLPRGVQRPAGCAFAPRCASARQVCREVAPALQDAGQGTGPLRRVRCHLWSELAAAPASAAGRPAGVAPPPPAEPRVGGPAEPGPQAEPLLAVRDVVKHYGAAGGLEGVFRRLLGRPARPVRAVDGVSFEVGPGETLALVGESGCGKTTLGRAVAGLVEIGGGQVRFAGRDASQPAERRAPELRRQVQMVFQNPEASLNPRQSVGQALARPLERFLGLRGSAAERQVASLLRAVGLDPNFASRYPRQLSGGEKQRVAIARAFAGRPRLVVLDEPVSALDVSVQATVLNLLVELQHELGAAYVFISHDLSVVRYLADWIGVVYLGQLCELGPADELLRPPHHPYTEALLSAVPVPDPDAPAPGPRLTGPVPSPQAPPAGCRFQTRCPRKIGPLCESAPPPLWRVGAGHEIRCHHEPARLAELQEATGGRPGYPG